MRKRIILILAALLFRIAPAFDRWFERISARYERLLAWTLRRRTIVLALVAVLIVPTYFAFHATGQELFPDVDSSEFTLHMRASGGPRVEDHHLTCIENHFVGDRRRDLGVSAGGRRDAHGFAGREHE